MGKTILHYRRKMQAAAGELATVHAWRNHVNVVTYRVACRRCQHEQVIPRYETKGTYHAVLSAWTAHLNGRGCDDRPGAVSLSGIFGA